MEEYRFKTDSSALVKFEDINSAEQAMQLIGSEVYFENKYIEEGEADEVSLNYFTGFTIKDTDGATIGTITGIDDQTENWLFHVETVNADVLIPAHEDFIIEINHKDKIIEMDLPEGLLDL